MEDRWISSTAENLIFYQLLWRLVVSPTLLQRLGLRTSDPQPMASCGRADVTARATQPMVSCGRASGRDRQGDTVNFKLLGWVLIASCNVVSLSAPFATAFGLIDTKSGRRLLTTKRHGRPTVFLTMTEGAFGFISC